MVGLRTDSSAQWATFTADADDTYWENVGPEPAVGASLDFLGVANGHLLNMSAILETTPPTDPPTDPPVDPPPPTRSLTIAYKKSKAFKGLLSSSDPACIAGEVTVFRKKPGNDKRIGADETDATGRYKVAKRNAPKGKYYASVGAAGTCPAATSPNVKVK